MPFDFSIHKHLDIVVVTARRSTTLEEIMAVMQESIKLQRGAGYSRRLLDLTHIKFSFTINEGRLILRQLQVMIDALNAQKVAILFKEIHSAYVLEKLMTLPEFTGQDIGIFVNKDDALKFLKDI